MIDRPYRILSFGAGAIGTYIGGSLALQGHSVVFLERQEIAAHLRLHGLKLNIDSIEHNIADPQIASSLEEALSIHPFDFAIFALKSFDTQSALDQMTPHLKDIPPILCLQNGVENEMVLASLLGTEKVIPCTVTSAIGRISAGNVILEKKRGVGIADHHPLSRSLVQVFSQANLNAMLYENASGMKWSKMITNLLANALSAILDMTPYDIYANLDTCKIEVTQIRETLRVMKALKIPVVNLPGTSVKLLTWVIQYLPLPLCSLILKQFVGKGRGGKMPSFHIDLYNKSPRIEVDYLNGAVVRFGKKTGIPTPINHFLNQTLLDLSADKQPLDTYWHNIPLLLESINQFL